MSETRQRVIVTGASLALAPLLAGGRILHLSSGAAHEPLQRCLSYALSKAALHMVYRCLQRELAGHGALRRQRQPRRGRHARCRRSCATATSAWCRTSIAADGANGEASALGALARLQC